MFIQPYVRKVRQLLGGPDATLSSGRDAQLAQQLLGSWETSSLTLTVTQPVSASLQAKVNASHATIARTNERLRTAYWTFRLTLRANHTYTYEMHDPSRVFYTEVGQWQVRNGELLGTVGPESVATMTGQAKSAVKGRITVISSTELVVQLALCDQQLGLEEVIRRQRVSLGSTL